MWHQLVFALILTVATAAVPEPHSAGPHHDLAVELVDNQVFLAARVGGETLSVALDTGAGGAVLDRAMVGRLGLELSSRSVTTQGAGGTMQLAQLAAPLELDFTGALVDLGIAQVAPLDDLSRRVGRRVDAIIGRHLLEQYVTQIDYEAERLRLHPPGSDPASPAAEWLELDFIYGIPTVEATLVAHPDVRIEGTFFVDSGAQPAVILGRRAAERFAVARRATRRIEVEPHGAHHEFAATLVRFESLELGSLRFDRPVGMLSGAPTGALAGDEVLGVIGAGFLERFTVTLDYGRRRMALEPNPRWGEPADFKRSGLDLVAADSSLERVLIRMVLPGTPAAEVGLRAGDEVVALDGTPATALTLPEMRQRLELPGPVRLRVRRGDHFIDALLETRELL